MHTVDVDPSYPAAFADRMRVPIEDNPSCGKPTGRLL